MKITKVDENNFKATFKQDIGSFSVDNQVDKYLFDRKKTIGFRKDKKLHKFVGLRDGYSKQLEFTIKSVIIDGEEKIASNRVNFTDLSVSGETIIHNINGIDFYNKIDLTNYKNLVKIDENFNTIDILYEIHLKGIKLYEQGYQSNGKTHFRQNQFGQFLIVDDGNNNILFKIENPVAFDEIGKMYNIISHELYEENNVFYYKKSILDNTIKELPLYIDASVTFIILNDYSNIQSYNYNSNSDLSWNGARNGIGNLYQNTNNESTNSITYNIFGLESWTPNSHWNVWMLKSNGYDIYRANSSNALSKSESNVFNVPRGVILRVNTVYINHGGLQPILSVEEFGYGSTGITSIPINTIINHTLSTGTTSVRLVITVPSSSSLIFEMDFDVSILGGVSSFYDSYIDRQFLYFDTSQLYQIAIDKMKLDFTLSNPSTGEYVIQKANTFDDNVINTTDFNTYEGNPYTTFIATPGSYTGDSAINLGQDIINDFVDKSITKLVIRENNYDYGSSIPTADYTDTITHNWSYQLNVEVSKFIVTETTIIDFSLESNGFGVIYSRGSTYMDTYSGITYTDVVHNSTAGTYSSGATYDYDLSNHGLYRTFLNFDTSILSIYDRYIIKNVKLVIKNHNYNDDISICQGLQDTLSGLTSTEFMSFGDFYTNVEGITLNSLFNVNLDEDVVNISGNTKFVIRNKEYDYEKNSSSGIFASPFGIDFSETYFEVELEPYSIYGVDYINVEKGTEITLYASRNTSEGEIYWATDSGITNILKSGNTLTINTINYNKGDIIYAAILDISGNTISYNILSVYLDLFILNYNGLPERNFDAHAVDLDSVYFKFHKCLSGVTYAYVRELDDIYEQNREVSDGEGVGSYNMYNEWDIIDEFFDNSHEVEVVGRLDEMDLNISYKRINNVYIHEGTRVLLHSRIPTANDGVYVADFNLKLHKTDELEDADTAFRYIAHVGAGDYLDYEFHTMYYTGIAPFPDWYEFDYLDADIYGDMVIDLLVYGDVLFDSNEG